MVLVVQTGDMADKESDGGGSGHGSVSIETHSPADVFTVLGSDTRIEILEALADPPGESRSFSTLYDSVGIDDSGNFSYHLDKLLGIFVRHEGEEYVLTHAGEQIVGSIHAGTYQADASVEPTAIGGTCQLCGGDLLFEYTDEQAAVYCKACDQGRSLPFPAGCLSDYPVEDLPAATARWYRTYVKRILDGFCPVCTGPMSGELVRGAEPEADPPRPSMASFDCSRCGKEVAMSAATIATFHPVVEGFLFEQGFDTRTAPHSEVWGALDDSAETVETRDPLTVELSFTHGTERVSAVVGPDATVRNTDRYRPEE
jgi:hypothetical protein